MVQPQPNIQDPCLEFEGSFAPKQPSIFWRGAKVVIGLIAETPLSVIGFLILGIVLQVLFPPLSGCCFVLAFATLASKFLWKILTPLQFNILNELERNAVSFQEQHPYFQAACLAAAFGLAIISSLASVLAAAALGIFNGIVAEANLRYIITEKKRAEENTSLSKQMNEVLAC